MADLATSPDRITVTGRRWFERTYGNTYHTARVVAVYADGETFDDIVPFSYGYDDQYTESARELLTRASVLPEPEKFASGGYETLRNMCERLDIALTFDVSDVARRADLHNNGRS